MISKLKTNIIFLILLLPFFCLAQNFSKQEKQVIDSLNKLIAAPNTPDTSLAEAYNGLTEILYVSNIDTMKPLCLKTQKIVNHALLNKELTSQTIKSLNTSLALALNNLGYYYESKGDVPLALDYYHNSLKVKEKIDDKRGIATSLNNIGMIYLGQNDMKLAVDYFSKSLKLREEIDDQYGIANSYNNLGLLYYKKKNYQESLNYFKKSLDLRLEINDKKNAANSITNIGSLYRKMGDNNKALEYYYKSLALQEELNNQKGIVNSLSGLGQMELKMGHLSKAKKMGKRAMNISQEKGLPDQVKRSARLLYNVAIDSKDWKTALDMRNLEIKTTDSLTSERAIKAAANQQAKYEYEKQKAIDDAQNEKLLVIEQNEKEKQKLITYSIGFGLILIIIFSFFIYNRLQITKKQKLQIEDQKRLVEKAHNELEGKNQEVIDSIAYAKRIQSAILPSSKLIKQHLKDSFILYKPKDIVAGDFYWMEHKGDEVLFAAADCTGHGVPGAMISVVCHNALNRSVKEYGLIEPGKILDKTREIVVQEFEKSEEDVKDGMDIALCSLKGNVLKYAGAHNPLWIIRNEEIIETKANKQPIGKFESPLPYTTHSFELQKGDSIYIFSDGYVDQFGGEKGKKFKAKAFKELLLSVQEKTLEEQKTIINDTFNIWKGNLEQVDDVCVFGVKVM